jgi:nucleotide-binding universal stress UspA family protein
MSDIVVGIDASEGSVAALRWAVRDARLRGVSVQAVLAWAAEGRPPEVDEAARSGHLDDLAHAAGRLLRRVVDAVEAETGPAVKITERIVYSTPTHALLDESLDAQMLVVGARRQRSATRTIIGSVGDVCAHEACVPVVVVRERGFGERDTRPVVAGVDGSAPSIDALRWAAREAALRKVPLQVVHAYPVMPPRRGASPVGGVAATAAEEDWARDVLTRCVAECLLDSHGLDIRLGVVGGDSAAALVEAAADAQMLVVGARGLGGFDGLPLGSTSHQCVTRARCPVAVVRVPHGE